MADNGSFPSPTDKYRRATSSLLSFTASFLSESESAMSPTSILDNKLFSGFRSSFLSKTLEIEPKRHWENLDSKGIGLGIVDSLDDCKNSDSKLIKPNSRMVVFGSDLKIQIPPLLPHDTSLVESPRSPADFGIKTRPSQLGYFTSCLSPSNVKKSAFGSENLGFERPSSPGVFSGCLSASEMELSEDYTCVISRGPNPRTTHIFDNCIIDTCCGVVKASSSVKENGFFADGLNYPSDGFLSFCFTCRKELGHGKDIYIYRGEKAFCSQECRCQEMLIEEGVDN